MGILQLGPVYTVVPFGANGIAGETKKKKATPAETGVARKKGGFSL